MAKGLVAATKYTAQYLKDNHAALLPLFEERIEDWKAKAKREAESGADWTPVGDDGTEFAFTGGPSTQLLSDILTGMTALHLIDKPN